jgi:hypothetical protein
MDLVNDQYDNRMRAPQKSGQPPFLRAGHLRQAMAIAEALSALPLQPRERPGVSEGRKMLRAPGDPEGSGDGTHVAWRCRTHGGSGASIVDIIIVTLWLFNIAMENPL